MNYEIYNVIFLLLRKALFQSNEEIPNDFDYEQVSSELREQALFPLIRPIISSLPIDAMLKEKYKNEVRQAVSNAVRTEHEEKRVVEILKASGVPEVVLKGSAAAKYYPEPLLRVRGDIDFLVLPEDFERANAVLSEAGIQTSPKSGGNSAHNEYFSNGIEIELHHHYFVRYYSPELESGDEMLFGLIRSGNITEGIPYLPDAENGIVLLQHLKHHLLFSGIGLRQIVDWAMFVNDVCDNGFWENRFQQLCEFTSLTKLARIATKMCRDLMGFPLKATWCDSADLNACEMLLNNVLLSGNFGKKGQDNELFEDLIVDFKYSVKQWYKYYRYSGKKRLADLPRGLSFLKTFAGSYYFLYQCKRFISEHISSRELRTKDKQGIWHMLLIKKLGL